MLTSGMSKRPLEDLRTHLLGPERAAASAPPAQDKLARYKAGVAASKRGRAPLQPQQQPRPGFSWTADNDRWLWNHRHESVAALAQHLTRGEGAIKARLEHLGDPNHAAYQRLHTHKGSATLTARLRPSDTSKLNSEQKRAVELAADGESFFLTGGAGTGKSYTLGHVVSALQRRHGKRGVFVTGSTGIAACHVNGTTLHSFAGIGLGKDDAAALATRIDTNRNAKQRWSECCALVIDEVSMLDGELFDKVEAIGRIFLDPSLPFGGIQVILCGDFFQV